MRNSGTAVEVHDLSRAFGSFVAVDKISLPGGKGGDLRLPGTQRGGEIDDHKNALRTAHADRRGRDGRRARYPRRAGSRKKDHRLYVAEILPLRRSHRGREHRLLRRGLQGPKGKERGAQGLGPDDGRDRGQEKGPDGDARYGFQTTPRPRLRRPSRASRPVPRRADVRRRPHVAAQVLGPDTGDGGLRARPSSSLPTTWRKPTTATGWP